jgi:hypothetical protein
LLCITGQRQIVVLSYPREYMAASAYPYRIDTSKRLVTATMFGSVPGTRIAATIAAIYGDPACGQAFDILWDFSTITELIFERDDLPSFVRLSRQFSHLSQSGRDIILVTRKLDKEMAEMYAVMMRAQRRAVHICASMYEVMQILSAKEAPAPLN